MGTADKESPQKEVDPVEEVRSQPHLMQQKEIQEKKPEVVKDVSADEGDTAAKDVKKIDSSEIPELETVQIPQEKEAPKQVTPKEKPKQVAADTKQDKKEDASVKKEAPKPGAPVALKEKPKEIAAESKQVKKEYDYAKKQDVPVKKPEVVEQPKIEQVKDKNEAEVQQEIEVISDET